jgi:hypothetical protein
VVVVSALPMATRVGLVVRAFWLSTGVGVPPDAWLSCLPLLRTALAPSLVTPVRASTWTAPEVLLPVATVTTVEVVLTISAVRMNTLIR